MGLPADASVPVREIITADEDMDVPLKAQHLARNIQGEKGRAGEGKATAPATVVVHRISLEKEEEEGGVAKLATKRSYPIGCGILRRRRRAGNARVWVTMAIRMHLCG